MCRILSRLFNQSINQSIVNDHKGCVYVEVPDAARYADYVFAPFQDFNTEHINHFSQISLANLMRSEGFTLKERGEKIIESSPNMPYPAIWFWGVKNLGSVAPMVEFDRDEYLVANIRRYIAVSQAVMNQIEAKLQQTLAQSPQVIVWGTGQLVLKLLAETPLAKAQIAAFVDGNPINQGMVLRGVPILAPEQIRKLPHPIVVTTILHQQEIAEQIRRMGLLNDIVLLGKVA